MKIQGIKKYTIKTDYKMKKFAKEPETHETNEEGYLKRTDMFKSHLKGNFNLSVNIVYKEQKDIRYKDYWCTYEELFNVHALLIDYINTFGMVRVGDYFEHQDTFEYFTINEIVHYFPDRLIVIDLDVD